VVLSPEIKERSTKLHKQHERIFAIFSCNFVDRSYKFFAFASDFCKLSPISILKLNRKDLWTLSCAIS
jgi:hypothetical protein